MKAWVKEWRERQHQTQNGRCYYCACQMTLKKSQPTSRTIDHFWPKSLGGSNGVNNYVLACWDCNQAKGDQPPFLFPAHSTFKQDYLARLNRLLKTPKLLTEPHAC